MKITSASLDVFFGFKCKKNDKKTKNLIFARVGLSDLVGEFSEHIVH